MLHEVRHGAEEPHFEPLQVVQGSDRFFAPEVGVAHAVAAEILDAPLRQGLIHQSVDPPVVEEFVELIVGPGDEGRHVGRRDPAHGDGPPEEQGAAVGHLDHVVLEGFVHLGVIDQFPGVVQAYLQPAPGHLLHPFDEGLDHPLDREGPGRVVALELPVENLIGGRRRPGDGHKAEDDHRHADQRYELFLSHPTHLLSFITFSRSYPVPESWLPAALLMQYNQNPDRGAGRPVLVGKSMSYHSIFVLMKGA